MPSDNAPTGKEIAGPYANAQQAQPWKEHWPATEEADGPSHGCAKGEVLAGRDGDTVSKPGDRKPNFGK